MTWCKIILLGFLHDYLDTLALNHPPNIQNYVNELFSILKSLVSPSSYLNVSQYIFIRNHTKLYDIGYLCIKNHIKSFVFVIFVQIWWYDQLTPSLLLVKSYSKISDSYMGILNFVVCNIGIKLHNFECL